MFNKKYKKGIKDAAKAYEAFGKKQEKALEVILEELRSGNIDIKNAIEKLDGNINALYEYLNSKELAKLYTVYTPFDIKNFKDNEKLFLSGALLKLTMDKVPTDDQQNYLRAVLKYLELKEPPFGVDLFAIENITDTNTQKAIYQTILEYLILQDGDNYDETEMQHEFLESFSLNTHQRQTIAEHVEILYSFTGSIGLSEKYGYVPEEDNFEQNTVERGDSIDDEEVSEENVKKVIQLALDYKIYSHETMICLKDYIFISTETNNTLISGKNGDKDEIDWLPHNIMFYDYISYKNKVCCSSSIGYLLIDFDKKEFKEIFSGKRIKPLVAMNDKYIVSIINKDGSSFIMVYDVLGGSDSIIDVENADWLNCAKFINDDIYFHILDNVYKYNIISKQFEKLFTISDEKTLSLIGVSVFRRTTEYKLLDSTIYNNRLYILSEKKNTIGNVKKGHIYSFDINNPKYGKFVTEINLYHRSCYNPSIFKFDNGWLFVSEENTSIYSSNSKYTIRMFNCNDENITELANNCGGKSKYTDSIDIGKMNKWGDYVFFDYYEQNKDSINACVSIKEPMNIILTKNKRKL